MRLFVTVKTRAREEKVVEIDTTHFVISVHTPPVQGRANEAVRIALARHMGIAASQLSLRSGSTGRRKVFEYESPSGDVLH